MKIGVRDIARRAGVSPATVSNALNGRPGVSSESARYILHVAREMGYLVDDEPKAVTKSFVRLVVFKNHELAAIDTQFYAELEELIEGVEHECQQEGIELVISHINKTRDVNYNERVRAICDDECAGILLMATEMLAEDLEPFKKCASPVLAIDNLFPREAVHSVVMNNLDAGYEAVSALYAAGHRDIAHITSHQEINNMRYRKKGYDEAMADFGLAVDEARYWHVTPTFERAYEDMKRLLADGRKLPTAFFAANDIIAIGCMRAMQERGIIVPDDVSVIGMDDMSICQISTPQLTTIRVYRREMGAAAMRTLLDLRKCLAPCIIKTELSISLVARQSVRDIS